MLRISSGVALCIEASVGAAEPRLRRSVNEKRKPDLLTSWL
jgi:hypothetical protein